MFKKIIFTVALIFIAFTSFAQIFEPVKWNVEQKNIDNNTAEIQFSATIDEGWHLYEIGRAHV